MMGRESTIDLFRPPTTETSSNTTEETTTSSSSTGGFSSPSSNNNNNSSSASNIDPDHLRVTPLACVSLFEHVYMPKYGVNGKEDYVRDWIKFLDWKSIEKA
jgi:superoxide dismutase